MKTLTDDVTNEFSACMLDVIRGMYGIQYYKHTKTKDLVRVLDRNKRDLRKLLSWRLIAALITKLSKEV